MFLGITDPTTVYINLGDNINIFGKTEVELLGITIDNKLTFKSHIQRLCRLANNKISALVRFRNLINFEQTNVLINAYIMSYFFYCPLIWMFCGKTEYALIEKTHKRALRILQNNFTYDYKQLLEISVNVNIHVRHLQHLMTEIYKTTNSTNPEFMKQVFKQKECVYNLRNKNLLTLPPTRTTTFGIRSISFKGSLISNMIPNSFKEAKSTAAFRNQIKNWQGTECSCKICQ